MAKQAKNRKVGGGFASKGSRPPEQEQEQAPWWAPWQRPSSSSGSQTASSGSGRVSKASSSGRSSSTASSSGGRASKASGSGSGDGGEQRRGPNLPWWLVPPASSGSAFDLPEVAGPPGSEGGGMAMMMGMGAAALVASSWGAFAEWGVLTGPLQGANGGALFSTAAEAVGAATVDTASDLASDLMFQAAADAISDPDSLIKSVKQRPLDGSFNDPASRVAAGTASQLVVRGVEQAVVNSAGGGLFRALAEGLKGAPILDHVAENLGSSSSRVAQSAMDAATRAAVGAAESGLKGSLLDAAKSASAGAERGLENGLEKGL